MAAAFTTEQGSLLRVQPEKALSSSAGSGEHKVDETGGKKEAMAPGSSGVVSLASGPSGSNTRVRHPHKDSSKSGHGKRLQAPTSTKATGALKAPL